MMRNPSKSSLVSIYWMEGGGGGGETNVFEKLMLIEQYSSNHCSLFVEPNEDQVSSSIIPRSIRVCL